MSILGQKIGGFRPSNLLGGTYMNAPIGDKTISGHTASCGNVSRKSAQGRRKIGGRKKLECGPMPNVIIALPNIGGALCSMLECLADAHYLTAVQ